MVRIFVQQIIDGWKAAPADDPGLGVRGFVSRVEALEAVKRQFPIGTEFEIQDMILGIPVGDPTK